MRILAGLATIVLGLGGATCALADAAPDSSAEALANAAFAPRNAGDFGDTLHRETFVGGKPVRWSTSEVQLRTAKDGGPVDTLRVSQGGVLDTPGGLPLNLDRAEFASKAYDVSVVRSWPSAIRFGNDRIGVDVSPHAGVGMTSLGGSAEAGAELRLQSRDDKAAERLRAMGVKDGATFGNQGRWYLFAAASGRAVGLNMLRSDHGWDRAGWTTDTTSTLIGDAHVGVGYRKGSLQSSFGVIHREVKGSHMVFGQDTKDDTLLALSLSIKPRVK